MPFDASGQFGYSTDTELPAVPNTVIKSAPYNALAAEIAAALGLTFLRDGSVSATGDFDMDDNVIQKLGLVYDRLAAARQSQVQVVMNSLAAGDLGLLKDSAVWKVNHTASAVSGYPPSADTTGVLTVVALPSSEVQQTYITDSQDFVRTFNGSEWGDWTVVDYTAGFTVTNWDMTAPAGSTSAALPTGAKDGQIYKVTAGGVFDGLTTEAGDYYLLYAAMAKLLPLYQVTQRLTVGLWNPVTSTTRDKSSLYSFGVMTDYASAPAGKVGGTFGLTVVAGVPVADVTGSYRYTGKRLDKGGSDAYYPNVGSLKVDQLKLLSTSGSHYYGTLVVICNDGVANINAIVAEVLGNTPSGSVPYVALNYIYTGTTTTTTQTLTGLNSDGSGGFSYLFPANQPTTPNGQLQLTMAANSCTVAGIGNSFSMPSGVVAFHPAMQASNKEIYVILYTLELDGSTWLDDYRLSIESDLGIDTVVSAAAKPADAVDGKVYKITGEGTYEGIQLKVDDFVQFYNSTADFIITRLGDGTLAGTLTSHIANTSNPHAVTKAQVGLGSVNNTADADKPVSTLQQEALDLKLTENTSPAASGTALTMTKSGTNGQFKKLKITGDMTISSDADSVTIGASGSTLKKFQEDSSDAGNVYRGLAPNDTGAIRGLYLGGREASTGGSERYWYICLTDPAVYRPVPGFGALDLQTRRDNINQTAAGNFSLTLGQFNRVSADYSSCLGASEGKKVVSAANAMMLGNVGTGYTVTVSGAGTAAWTMQIVGSTVTHSGTNGLVLGGQTAMTSAGGYLKGGGSVATNSHVEGLLSIYSMATDGGVINSIARSQLPYNAYNFNTGFREFTGFRHAMTATAGTWYDLTSDGATGGTTNRVQLSSSKYVAFFGYVCIMAGTARKIFKLEGAASNTPTNIGDMTATYTATLVHGSANAYDGELQVVISGNSLCFQVRWNTGSDVGTGGHTFHATAALTIYQLI